MKPTDIDIESLLKRLHLANARRVWRELIVRAETDQWSFRDFLAVLLAEEVAHPQQTRLARLSRRAEFPFLKTIDDFDFTFQSTLRLALLGSALAPDFVTEGRCLILYGKPGRGKTHLALANAYRAIQNGFDALFVTAAELIDKLSAAFRQGRLSEVLALYTHPHVLVASPAAKGCRRDDSHHHPSDPSFHAHLHGLCSSACTRRACALRRMCP